MTVVVPKVLQEWAPPHADWTSGLLLQYGDGYLFALEPHAHWTWDEQGLPRIRVVGIGATARPGRPGAKPCSGKRRETRPLRQVVMEGARFLPGTPKVPDGALLTLGGSAQWIARFLRASASTEQE